MITLHRVLYCSRNRLPGAPGAVAAEIGHILATSRASNARVGVTGALLFSDGCFAQVLEGPLAAVEATFERIQCDDRHSDVTVLQSGAVEARGFAGWSMAFAGADAAGRAHPRLTLAAAFSGQSSAGDGVLEILRSVVRRETEWLAPVAG